MLLQSKRIWVAGQFMPAQLSVEDGNIAAVLPYGVRTPDQDYGELRLIPGFIDTHTHGAYGVDTNETDEEGLRHWIEKAPSEGITAFLPTTVTQSDAVLTHAVKNTAAVAAQQFPGAEIVGIHMEGPYLGLKYKGAQPPEFIVKALPEQFDRWQEAAVGLVRLMTVAPEEDDGYSFIRYLSARGVAVNMGHTDATYEQAALAVANGASGITHTHNAMSPYSHKGPGMVNAALRFKDVYCEIIPDGIHVPFPIINSFFDCKGGDYAVVVTDSLLVKGGGQDSYDFGGQRLSLKEGGGAVLTGTTTLAGSTLSFNQGLRNLVEKALVPFGAALNACTINPARHIGMDGRKGKLVAGYDADIVVLADDYTVVQTYCRGIACL